MSGRRANKTGRNERLPDFTSMFHHVLDSPAYLSLTPLAQCLFVLLMRRAGYKGARNGEVFLSVREVAEHFKIGKDTASAAFHLLQARGFIRPTQIGSLGIEGEGRATTWILTVWPTQNGHAATRDFLSWTPGHDFAVKKGRPPRHKTQNPVRPRRTARPSPSDVAVAPRLRQAAACPSLPDDEAVLETLPVLSGRTPKDLPGGGGT